jgi:adenylate kinase family enzyme
VTLTPYDSAVLTADDPLPSRPHRVAVAGVSGVGKTTVARHVAGVLGCTHVEIDALFHGPGWAPRVDFLADVERFTAQDDWVTEWQYADARGLLAERADVLVWLDLPFALTLSRVVRRTLRRRLRRERLWNGNVEPPLHTFLTDREHIVRWAIATRHKYHDLVSAAERDHPPLTVVRLRSRGEVDQWVRRLGEWVT